MKNFPGVSRSLRVSPISSATAKSRFTYVTCYNYHKDFLMAFGNSNKLKNSAALSSGEFFSLSTGAAEIFIFIVLRVLLIFFISRDVGESCMSPTLYVTGSHPINASNGNIEFGSDISHNAAAYSFNDLPFVLLFSAYIAK